MLKDGYELWIFNTASCFNPIQDPILSPCNFCKRRTYPRKTSDFWFQQFYPNCVKIPRPYPVLLLNYWTWTKTTPQNKCCFWSNLPNIEVRITFLIELPNFGHITTSTIYNFESCDKSLLITSWSKIIRS